MTEQLIQLLRDLLGVNPSLKIYLKILHHVCMDYKQRRMLTLRELSRRIGISPKNIRKYVEQLRQLGYIDLYESTNAILVLPGEKAKNLNDATLHVISSLIRD